MKRTDGPTDMVNCRDAIASKNYLTTVNETWNLNKEYVDLDCIICYTFNSNALYYLNFR